MPLSRSLTASWLRRRASASSGAAAYLRTVAYIRTSSSAPPPVTASGSTAQAVCGECLTAVSRCHSGGGCDVRQYACAHTTSATAAVSQEMHLVPGFVSPTSGRQRIVAALSSLTRRSHSALPHQDATANPHAPRRYSTSSS